jgi:two-component system, LytTR family, sensor kinase
MKRLIILLLLLSSFRISYAQELTAEQQQLAWKFIYDKVLLKSTDFHPTVFKEDIVINLKGKVTTEDSMIVKDIIKDFQKAIPHLKITLSDSPGNLILGLDFNKMTSITSNFNLFEAQSRKMQISLPENLNSYQRKQFIYYWLCNGFFYFNDNNSPVNILGLNGCVFCENDFDSITFSPFDLFILEKIYSPQFPLLLAQNLDDNMQQTAWTSIRTKFLGHTKKPIIYRSDIAIKLEGIVTSVDSTFMNELIERFKLIIPNRKIFLTSGKGNLVFNFMKEGTHLGYSAKMLPYSIQFKNVDLFFPANTPLDYRKRVLYYNLVKSLVNVSKSQFGGALISGCVFDEEFPENITYQPADAYILNKIYADDFHDQFKKQYISQFSYREYLVLMYHKGIDLLSFLLALIIPAVLLTSLFIKGTFKPHRWSWKEYNKQGLYLMAICCIYLLFISLDDLQLGFQISVFSVFILQGLVAINLSYYIERFILRNRNLDGSKVIVIFLITFIVMLISFYSFRLNIAYESLIAEKSVFPILTFTNIILFSLARCLYVFLNDRYKSIINQKDVELAQMGEFQKQAELQSLRAKINPHFLYNALNSIASLATTDARKTEQMALALSDFFKYAINREQKQLNTLSEELNAIRTYLEIEKVRFGDRLSFEIDCPEDLLNIQIPQLLIQPLVENAIKHGLSQITENGLIRILVSRAENQLKIRVYDNGPAFPDGPLSGFGIQNTQERIALLYGAKATINWQNGAEKYIEISIPV